MNKRRALSGKNLPRGLHLQLFAVIWLLLDRLQAAQWVWGVVGTICFFLFIFLVYDFFSANDVRLEDLERKT